MPAFIDLTGRKVGRLTVLGRAPDVVQPSGSKKTMWRCVCECGSVKDIWSHALVSGQTRSCGCLQREVLIERNTTHGYSKTRLDRIYRGMKTRCYNASFPEYNSYGGRGITICDEWLNNPKSFYEWALQNGYRDDLSIDRIDVDANYSPANCRWVDVKTQNNNKSNNIHLTFNGETHTMAEWAEIIGMNYQTLKYRICRYKWSTEDALTKPIRIDSRNKSRYC